MHHQELTFRSGNLRPREILFPKGYPGLFIIDRRDHVLAVMAHGKRRISFRQDISGRSLRLPQVICLVCL